MSETIQQRSSRLAMRLLAIMITIVLLLMVGYQWAEAAQGTSIVAEEFSNITYVQGGLEQRSISVTQKEPISTKEAINIQTTNTQIIAEKAITTTQQVGATSDNKAGYVEQQAQITLARQLATNSELAIQEGGGNDLSLATLLAIESVSRYPTMEGDKALRNALSLMPRLEFKLTKEGYIHLDQMAFDPSGRWIGAVDAYSESVSVWDLTTGEIVASLSHDDRVSDVAFDPSGRLMATTAADGTARLWEIGTWKQIIQLKHDGDQVTGATFNPTGTRLATTNEVTVYIWDVSTGQEITRLKHKNNVSGVAFSPYGKWVTTFDTLRSVIWIWDVETGQEITQLKHNSLIKTMAFSPYGKWLATANGNTAQVWEINTGRQVMRVMHRDVVNDVAFSPDTTLLATASDDKTARLWDVAAGRERMQFAHKDQVVSIGFSPDGKSLATGSGPALSESPARIWDVATGREVARMEHPTQVEEVHFSPDGHQLATQDRNNQVIYVWNLSPGVPNALHIERENSVKAVAFSADGSILASGNNDGSLQMWDTISWQEITPASMKHKGEIRAISFNSDGSLLASAAADGTASVWNLTIRQELFRVMHVGEYASWLTDVTFSPDGKLLATSGSDDTARLWDITTGREIARTMHDDVVWHVDFSPDGQQLASVSSDRVRVLVAPDWQEIAMLRHIEARDIAYSPDGSLLASVGGDDMARVWDTKTWQEIVSMKHNDQNEFVSAVAFSPDGRLLATGSGSTMTRVWNTKTWEEIARIPTGVDMLLFSSDGRWLFTQQNYGNRVQVWDISMDGREVVRIESASDPWDMALSPNGDLLATTNGDLQGGGQLSVTQWRPDNLVAEACSRLARNLAWSEWQQYLGNQPYSETCPGLPTPTSVSDLNDMIHDITTHLCVDDPDVALLRYESTVSLTLRLDNEVLSNSLCWYGTQEGFANTVLPVCEQAVKLAPDNISVLDSRGMARAMAGDSQEALEDLSIVVVAWEGDETYSEIVSQRKQVIKALEQGQDVTSYVDGCQDFAAVKSTPSEKTSPPTATPTPDTSPIPQPEAELQPTDVVRSFVADIDRVVRGKPGETVSHTLTVTNTGNITGSYDLWVKPRTYYSFSLPELHYGSDTFDYTGSVGELGPGDSIQMPIDVRIPNSVTNEEFGQFSLLVRSNYTPGVSMQMVTAVSDTTSIEQVGHIGLNARDVFVRDDYAYVAAGMKGLRILDVSDVLSPVEVGYYKTTEGALGQVERVQVIGDHAYVVTNLSGLHIVDVSNPASPTEVGTYRPGGTISSVKLSGNYAYIVWNSCLQRCIDKLRIVDISDPTTPVEVNAYGAPFESGGYGSGDRMNDVAVMGDYAYLFMPNEMRVLDVSTPAQLVAVDSYEHNSYEVIVWGDYVYSRDDNQMRVMDISNPELIVEVGVYDVPDTIVNISQAGDYFYVTTEKDDVYILDLVVPSLPAQVAIYNTPGNREVRGAAVNGDYVYLAAGSAGLQIIDISDPSTPEQAGVYGASTAVMGVALAEDYAYVADRYNGLRVLKLETDPSALIEVGFYNEPGIGALDMAVDGDYAYVILGLCQQAGYQVACYGDLNMLDVTDPAAPFKTSVYQGEWHKIEVLGDYAFVSGRIDNFGDKAFHILDISNPATLKQVATYNAFDFTLADGYLYLLSDKKENMTILDAATLETVAIYDMSEHDKYLNFAREIAVEGDHAYILENYSYTTGSGASWRVIDVSNPTTPVQVKAQFDYKGQHESWGEPAAATYNGYTFLAAKHSGLRVLDITSADNPTEVDSFSAPDSIMDVAVDSNGYIYTASDLNGLHILRYVIDSKK